MRRSALLPLLLATAIPLSLGCSSDREPTPEERTTLFDLEAAARAGGSESRRYREAGSPALPVADSSLDLYVADGTLFAAGDSISARLDSTSAEYHYLTSEVEVVVRMSKSDTGWQVDGTYVR